MAKRRNDSKAKASKKAKTDEEVESTTEESTATTEEPTEETPMTSAGDEKNGHSECDRVSPSGETYGLKIMTWNVSGLRAVLKKDGMKSIDKEDADIICLQETKCDDKTYPEQINVWNKYRYKYHNHANKKGYSGVSLYSKVKPIKVDKGIGVEEHDDEGRVITAEYKDFFLVTVYVPNSGRGLVRLGYRQKWNTDFEAFLMEKNSQKPVILCGDLNVSHKEIDLQNPKTNTKTAGFTKEEREDFSRLLTKGFVDSYRVLYPDKKKAYTFWSYFANSRSKDIGWRLDYFVISEALVDKLCDNQIRSKVMGSDHCPVVLYMALKAANE